MLIQETTRNYFKKKRCFFSGIVRAGEKIKYCITFQIPFSVNLLLRVLHMNLGSSSFAITGFSLTQFITTCEDCLHYSLTKREITSNFFNNISF